MSNYLLRYKGKYRVKAPYDLESNQFHRKLDGTLEDIDLYIPCNKGTQITHYGQSILQAWIPSAVRGRNIVKDVNDNIGADILFDIKDNETEMVFKFNSKHMDALAPYLKPNTGGADISPFSTRNLPKSTYTVPNEEMVLYTETIKNVPKENSLAIAHLTTGFIKNLDKKKDGYEKHKSEMARLCVKGKEYIHKIGEWEKYLSYLKTNLKEFN